MFCQVLERQRWFYFKLPSSIKSCFCRDWKRKIRWVNFKCKMCPSVALATELISPFWTKPHTLPKVKLYYRQKSQILLMIQTLWKTSALWSLKQAQDPFSNPWAMPVNWDLAGLEGGDTADFRYIFYWKSAFLFIHTNTYIHTFLKEKGGYTTPSSLSEICAKHFVKLWSGKRQSSNWEGERNLILH